MDPDDWLRDKLYTLRQKRGNDPATARRQVERDLLEELKNAPVRSASTNPMRKNVPQNQKPQQNIFGQDISSYHEAPQSQNSLRQNQPQQNASQNPLRQNAPHQEVQQKRPTSTHFKPDYHLPDAEPLRQANQPWNYKPNIDALRLANRENMDHTYRSRTPSYNAQLQGTYDRAAAVRQRSATPNILLPTGGSGSRQPLKLAGELNHKVLI